MPLKLKHTSAPPNKHGCLPPRGCALPSNPHFPQVATGNESKGSYEAAFLVDTAVSSLHGTFAATVGVLATLKAWFAYRLRTRAIKDGFSKQNALFDPPTRTPSWRRVWNLLQEKGVAWTEQHKKRGPRANPWEIQTSMSALDFFVHVLVALNLHIETNVALESEGRPCKGFRWHQYYYEDEGKYFLLYHFTCYLNTETAPSGKVCIYRPTDPVKCTLWKVSQGCQIHLAAQSYMTESGWDPTDVLSKALESVRVKSPAQDNKKFVTFIYSGIRKRQVFKKDIKTIRQHTRDSLRGTLKELFEVDKVLTRAVEHDKLIGSLDGLWASIKSSESPIFWMDYDDEDHKIITSATAQQPSERDYGSHAILKLEPLVDKLGNQDQARSAQSRFNLIRENHRHSAEFVKELTESFAPLETATTRRWQMISDRKRICDDAAKDYTQFYKLRHLIADLSDAQQVHARQYFTLITTNNPLASVAAENLIKLFTPDMTEAEKLSNMMGIFNEIKRDMVGSGGATIQS